MVDTDFPDSYIATDDELETLIGADTRASAIALKALVAASQAWYCQEATRRIDQMPLRGKKYDRGVTAGVPDQLLEFPRVIDGRVVNYNSTTNAAIVPTDVKRACLEEAIAIFEEPTMGKRTLQEQGVNHYFLGGNRAETFVQGAGTTSLQSARARIIMRRYMGAVTR